MKMEIPVWQFVRLMVYCENNPELGSGPGQKALLDEWGDVWRELDDELTELSSGDFERFADMMMDEIVSIDDVAAAHALAAADAMTAIAREMKQVISAGSAGEDSESIEFEMSELLRSAEALQNQLQ